VWKKERKKEQATEQVGQDLHWGPDRAIRAKSRESQGGNRKTWNSKTSFRERHNFVTERPQTREDESRSKNRMGIQTKLKKKRQRRKERPIEKPSKRKISRHPKKGKENNKALMKKFERTGENLKKTTEGNRWSGLREKKGGDIH